MVKNSYSEKFERVKIELIKYLILNQDRVSAANEKGLYSYLGINSSKEKKVLRKVLNKLAQEEAIFYDKKSGIIKLKTKEYEIGEIVLNGINDYAVEHNGSRQSVRLENLMDSYVGDTVLFCNKDKKIKSILKKSNNPRIFECFRVNDEIKIIPFSFKDTSNYRFTSNNPIKLTGNEILSAYVTYNEEEDIYECEIKEVIGSRTEREISGKIMLAANGIDINFSKKALEEAELIPKRVLPKEKENRIDLRDIKTFSIDNNERTVIFDDALSVERNDENNHYVVYLHTIDVAHYIKPGTELFKEARKRAKNIYMHNYKYTYTMLPPELSSGICSLVEGKDRLAKTISLEFDENGKLVAYDFFDSVIRVDKNFSSVEADGIYAAGFNKSDPRHNDNFIKEFMYLNRVNDYIKRLLPLSGLNMECGSMDAVNTNIIKIANEQVANHFPTLPFIYKTFNFPTRKEITRLVRNADFKRRYENYHMDKYTFIKYSIIENILDYYSLPRTSIYTFAVSEILRSKNYIFSTQNKKHFSLGVERYTHINSPARSFINLVNQLLFDYYGTIFPTDDVSIDSLYSELETICAEYNHKNDKYKKLERLNPQKQSYSYAEIDGLARGIIFEKGKNYLIVRVDDCRDYKAIAPGENYDVGDEVVIKVNKAPKGIANVKAKILYYKNPEDNI